MINLLANALAPVFAGLLLGFWAGRRGWMDNNNVRDLIALVMTFAVPCSLFSVIVHTTWETIERQYVASIVILLAFGLLYLTCYIFARKWAGMSVSEGAVLALTIGFANSAAVALPLLASTYGADAVVPAALSIVVGSITLSPVTLALLELSNNPTKPPITALALCRGVLRSFAKPVVWSPVVALLCVHAGVHFPSYLTATFDMLGSAASGSALLLTGLVISAQPFHLDAPVILSTLAKLIVQPFMAFGLCVPLGVRSEDMRAIILITAIPGGFFGLVFGKSFQMNEQTASSSQIVNYALSVLTLPMWILALNRWAGRDD